MKVLNLYACLGGNRYKWDEVDPELEVTAVELDPYLAELYQERFPNDTVIVADAHQYLLYHYQDFDFIWSSPPCQTHSKMNKATKHKLNRYPDMKLYQEIIFLDNFYNGKFCIENVEPYYKQLIPAQKRDRHLYWANFLLPYFEVKKMKNFSQCKRNEIAKWLGFDYKGENIYIGNNHDPAQVLRNCVHPDAGKTIFEVAYCSYKSNNTNQLELL